MPKPNRMLQRQRLPCRCLFQNVAIVGPRIRFPQEQRLHSRFCQDVAKVARTVGGVDVHQHKPRAGGGVLQQHPFKAVGCPDADAISRLEAKAEQTACDTLNLCVKFAPCEADVLMGNDERFLIGQQRCNLGETLRDGEFGQWGDGALRVAEGWVDGHEG